MKRNEVVSPDDIVVNTGANGSLSLVAVPSKYGTNTAIVPDNLFLDSLFFVHTSAV